MSVLVLVDWQNLFKSCQKRQISVERVFEEISRRILEQGQLEEIRLFAPNYQNFTGPWRLINSLQLKFGLVVEVCPVLREGAEMEEEYFKDVVDLSVYSWVVKHIHSGVGPDLVVFVSGDGDFVVVANEVRKRGKEVAFWIVDPETTSNVILRNFPVQEIKIAGQSLLGTGENPFLDILAKSTSGKELTPEDEKRLNILKQASKVLPTLAKPSVPEAMESAVQGLRESLSISGEEARLIVKALIVLEVIRIYPITSQGLAVDSSSLLFQWLQATVNQNAP